MKRWRDLFTPRQLVALTTFSDLVQEGVDRVKRDAIAMSLCDDNKPIRDDGIGATAYAEAVGVYLAFCVDKMTDTNTCLCSWQVDPPRLRCFWEASSSDGVGLCRSQHLLATRQGISGDVLGSLTEVLDKGGLTGSGTAQQSDARTMTVSLPRVFSLIPLLRQHRLRRFVGLLLRLATPLAAACLNLSPFGVPKARNSWPTPCRQREKAETFFLDGMTQAMRRLAERTHPAFPVTIYYAFKQSRSRGSAGTASLAGRLSLDAVIVPVLELAALGRCALKLATRNVGRNTNAWRRALSLCAALAPSMRRPRRAAGSLSPRSRPVPKALK